MKYILILVSFILFISCVSEAPNANRLSGAIKEEPETIIERNIKKAYPGCKIFQYKDNDLSSDRYLVITADSVIIIIDGCTNNKYPFDQNIFITRL